jgi:hypothetical protein
MSAEREDHERRQDTVTHLIEAEGELRKALRAALDADEQADLLRKLAAAIADVSYLIPWAVSLGEHESEGFCDERR